MPGNHYWMSDNLYFFSLLGVVLSELVIHVASNLSNPLPDSFGGENRKPRMHFFVVCMQHH